MNSSEDRPREVNRQADLVASFAADIDYKETLPSFAEPRVVGVATGCCRSV